MHLMECFQTFSHDDNEHLEQSYHILFVQVDVFHDENIKLSNWWKYSRWETMHPLCCDIDVVLI